MQGGWGTGARIVSVMLAMLLAVTMLPAAGLSSAYADEPVERPATSGGDMALESASGSAVEAQAAPVVPSQDDLGDDVIAVISAAIAAVMDEQGIPEGSYTVKSIKRAREARPAWAMAGMQQNTRPF